MTILNMTILNPRRTSLALLAAALVLLQPQIHS